MEIFKAFSKISKRAFGSLENNDEKPMKKPEIHSKWQNWKNGQIYTVLGVGRHTETRELLVAYFNEKSGLHFRPLSMWYDHIDRDGYQGPRFIEIKAGDYRGASQPLFGKSAKPKPVSKRGRI